MLVKSFMQNMQIGDKPMSNVVNQIEGENFWDSKYFDNPYNEGNLSEIYERACYMLCLGLDIDMGGEPIEYTMLDSLTPKVSAVGYACLHYGLYSQHIRALIKDKVISDDDTKTDWLLNEETGLPECHAKEVWDTYGEDCQIYRVQDVHKLLHQHGIIQNAEDEKTD